MEETILIFGRPSLRWIILKRYDVVHWILLVQGRNCCQAIINMEMDVGFNKR